MLTVCLTTGMFALEADPHKGQHEAPQPEERVRKGSHGEERKFEELQKKLDKDRLEWC